MIARLRGLLAVLGFGSAQAEEPTELLRTGLDAMSNGLLLIDDALQLKLSNPAAWALVGLAPDATIDTFPVYCTAARLRTAWGALDDPAELPHILAAFAAGEVDVLAANGRVLSTQARRWGEAGYVLTLRDVTDTRRAENSLYAAKEVAEAQSRRIRDILNNSGQGFLTFGRDLAIDDGASRECAAMFGGPVAGRAVSSVLPFPDDGARDFFTTTLVEAFADDDDIRREIVMSLLPSEFDVDGAVVQVEYRFLDRENRVMVVLTDVTSERALARLVAQERRRLEFVVAAASDSTDFFDILSNLDAFLGQLDPAHPPTPERLVELYRDVHTLKGLTDQFHFLYLPDRLHALEEDLNLMRDLTPGLGQGTWAMSLAEADLDGAFAQDIEALRRTLGQEFLDKRGDIAVPREVLNALQDLAIRAVEEGGTLSPATARLVEAVRHLKMVNVKELLRTYPDMVETLAGRLEKAVRCEVVGDDVLVDADRFSVFTQSLIHVFRNAIDHGIEAAEDRAQADKDPCGLISCAIARTAEGGFAVTVRDDGRGLDPDRLRAKAVERGIVEAATAAAMDDAAAWQLIFVDAFSTRETVTDLSGRGVGLAACRAEAEALGGRVDVQSTLGIGTEIRFAFPPGPAARVGLAA